MNAILSISLNTERYYDLFFFIEIIILIIFIPLLIIDLRLASQQKFKIKESQYQLAQKEKERLLAEKEKEIEDLRKQREAITEEDITVSKEKHFCLVHKGPIEGYSFICPDCGTFYCMKCVQAIVTIDNTCWSCENVIDAEMPIRSSGSSEVEKPVVEEEQRIKVIEAQNFCKFCGEPIDAKMNICPSCGFQLKSN